MNSLEVSGQIDANEIHGRLALWLFTFDECQRLLILASRAKDAATPQRLELQQERMRGLENLGPKNAPPIPDDPDGLNAYQRFNKDNPHYYAFPTYHDCHELSDYMQMYAIVAFCRVWKSGYRSEGKAKGNLDKKIQDLRDTMVSAAFPSTASRERFNTFLEQLYQARDSVLAHADGGSANIRFEEGLSLTLPRNVVHGIDMDYFAECVDLLLMRCRAC